ncbi:hypothetical protein HZH68_002671 [Vespula germanica]|uniref:Uncharacterized protein n=1 Tax=Vespula germanica TaxID=30212 RepID=A0A834NMS3_VESGE|nr:hypothetical protein HZH68_002671 [Vespula germanica]
MSMLDVTDIAISFSVSIPFPKHRGLVQKHIHGRPSRHGWGGNRYSRLPACLPTLRRTLNVSPLTETPPPTSPTSAYALHRPMDKGEEEKVRRKKIRENDATSLCFLRRSSRLSQAHPPLRRTALRAMAENIDQLFRRAQRHGNANLSRQPDRHF